MKYVKKGTWLDFLKVEEQFFIYVNIKGAIYKKCFVLTYVIEIYCFLKFVKEKNPHKLCVYIFVSEVYGATALKFLNNALI